MSVLDQSVKDRTACVRSIHEKVTSNIIFELFTQAGPVEHVALMSDHAFVTFDDSDSVPYACGLLNDTKLFGQEIQVNPKNGSCHNSANQVKVPPNNLTIQLVRTKQLQAAQQTPRFSVQQQLNYRITPTFQPQHLSPTYNQQVMYSNRLPMMNPYLQAIEAQQLMAYQQEALYNTTNQQTINGIYPHTNIQMPQYVPYLVPQPQTHPFYNGQFIPTISRQPYFNMFYPNINFR